MLAQSVAREIPVPARPLDLEIKDVNLIFDSEWAEFEKEFGRERLRFPKEICWLNGAPGAGKGTQTRFIMEFRDYTAPPILVSDLLDSPEATRLKDAGLMVGDREVTALVLRKLLGPEYQSGAIVDGYPRTEIQMQCLNLLYNKILTLHREQSDSPEAASFPRSVFHIIVLFISEAESVRRQLHRGRKALEENEQVRRSGMGELVEVRKTDLNQDAARERYRIFKEVTYDPLRTLRKRFFYHYIDAQGTVEEVQARIVEELRYQSSLELNPATYKRVNRVPLASSFAVHARQELTRRLDEYERDNTELFERIVEMIQAELIPQIAIQPLSGETRYESEDEMFADPLARAMMVDVLSERGYHALVDTRQYTNPVRINPETNEIESEMRTVYRFRVLYPSADIRREP